MHVRRSKINDNLLSRYPEPHGLQGRYSPEEAFLDSRIRQSHQMYAYSGSDIDLNSDRYRIDADTLRRMYVYEHINVFTSKDWRKCGKT